MAAIDPFLTQVLERDGSDLHFLAGDPPRVRQYGELKALSNEKLGAEMVKAALYEIMPKLALERFEAKDGTDFAYSIAERGALSGQRHAPAERHGRRVPRHSLQGAYRG